MTTIFVQIASYRDPQLVPTLKSLAETADHPENLSIGLCWQHGPDEKEDEFRNISVKDVRISRHGFEESRGLCWARSITNSLYRGEDLTMQLDSHHRFSRGWDSRVLEDYYAAKSFSANPILTSYLPPVVLHPSGEEEKSPTPTLMAQFAFKDRLLKSRPHAVRDHRNYWNRLIPARTLSGHFYVVAGSFIDRVPYDEKLYFGGEIEEISMSIRAWTHGYDFFSPSRDPFAWHEYRNGGTERRKHWEDHPEWILAEYRSRRRFDMLCGRIPGDEYDDPQAEGFGLGMVRSLGDYRIFSGIDFIEDSLHQNAIDVNEPRN